MIHYSWKFQLLPPVSASQDNSWACASQNRIQSMIHLSCTILSRLLGNLSRYDPSSRSKSNLQVSITALSNLYESDLETHIYSKTLPLLLGTHWVSAISIHISDISSDASFDSWGLPKTTAFWTVSFQFFLSYLQWLSAVPIEGQQPFPPVRQVPSEVWQAESIFFSS